MPNTIFRRSGTVRGNPGPPPVPRLRTSPGVILSRRLPPSPPGITYIYDHILLCTISGGDPSAHYDRVMPRLVDYFSTRGIPYPYRQANLVWMARVWSAVNPKHGHKRP